MKQSLTALVVVVLAIALLPLAASRGAAQGEASLVIQPEDDLATAVEAGSAVVVSGSLSSSGPITSATWVGIQADGTEVRQDIPSSVVEGGTSASYLRSDGDDVDGRLVLPCIYGNPEDPFCPVAHGPVVSAVLEVTTGAPAQRSTALPVDYIDPVLLRYDIVAPTEVWVVFSEPVRAINTADLPYEESPSDWTVEGSTARVVEVSQQQDDCRYAGQVGSGSGCTRVLTLSQPLGQDQTPRFDYNQQVLGVDDPNRTEYEDAARNIARLRGGVGFDRIRPAIPTIQSAAGREPTSEVTQCTAAAGSVLTSQPQPQLQVANVEDGHDVLVAVDGRDVTEPTAVPDGTRPFAVQLPAPLAEGPHLVEVIALDNASRPSTGGYTPPRNRSDQGTPPPSERSDGSSNPLCLTVDTRAPLPLAAVRDPQRRTAVLVTFDEPVDPASAGTWTIAPGTSEAQSTQQAEATDVPGQRRITFTGPIPAGDTAIRWSGADDSRYRDAAGNAVRDFTLPVVPLPPLFPPVVEVPGPQTPTHTNDPDITVAGHLDDRQQREDVSRVLVEGAGQTADAPVADDGSWAVDVTVPEDGEYRFTARTESVSGERSAPAASDAIEYDGTPPTAQLTYPSSDSGPLPLPSDPPERGAGPFDVEFTVEDPNGNFASATVTATFEGDVPQQVVEYTGNPGDGVVRIDVPLDYVGDVTIGLVGRDLAGNASDPVEGVVRILGDLLSPVDAVLDPNTPGSARIVVTFPAPLSGVSLPVDWSATNGIDGGEQRPPTWVEVDGTTVTLTFLQPFPGPVSGDPNATPRLDLHPLVVPTLSGPEGREVVVEGLRVRDVVPPASPVLAQPAQGPVRLDRDGYTATIAGETDASLKPNLVRVLRLPAGDQTTGGTVVRGLEPVQPDGTFAVDVPVTPNATSRFRVEVVDPNGNQAPDAAIATVLEDSLGPVVTTFTARLEGADRVLLEYGFDERASSIEIGYRAGGGDHQVVQTAMPVDATAGVYRWEVPDTVDLTTQGLVFTIRATDPLGNVGQPTSTPLTNVPRLAAASVLDEGAVTVTTTEPVTTDEDGAAGFSIGGGPGVLDTTVEGDRITLTLADPLDAGEFTVRYNGRGGWATADGRPLHEGEVPLVIPADVLFGVTGLAVGPSCTSDGAVLSFVDERNGEALQGYEVVRDGTVIATVGPEERIVEDPEAGTGPHVYEVTAVGADGTRSSTATARIQLGASPVPPSAADGARAGGTGAPPGASDGPAPFTAAPNIGPDGGTVLSCDGRVAALVPAGVLDGPAYGAIVPRGRGAAAGFDDVTARYQLVVVRDAPAFPALDAFTGFVELSARDLRSALDGVTRERLAVLRLAADAGADEKAARVGPESVATQLLTVGTFAVVEADGASVRVFGPDPAITADRFATAAALSQTQFASARTVVLARADDYPDALAAAPLAAQVGGPVLLSRTTDVPATTQAELQRLGTRAVVVVGGTAAISDAVIDQLAAAGIVSVRVAGPTRFETAAEVARRVGSVDGTAYLATGTTFADALAASAPAAALGRPILLVAPDQVPAATAVALDQLRITGVDVVGGERAVSDEVSSGLDAVGFSVGRFGGDTRYATAVALARSLVADGQMDLRQPVVASGDGDGVTSPDALAAGPIGGRVGSPLLLTPKLTLADEVADLLADPQLRGLYLAGGTAAVTAETRSQIDAAAG